MPIALPVATLIAGAVGAGAQAYGSHVAGKANTAAGKQQADATAAQLAFQREQEATRKSEYDAQQLAAKAAWDAEQARKAPYREAAQNAMVKLSRMTGLPAPSSVVAPPSSMPPPGWTPGGSPTTTKGGAAVDLPAAASPSATPQGVPLMDMMPNFRMPAAPASDPASAAIPLTTPLTAQQMYDAGMFGMPGRAGGGPVDEDQSYIVGENGPEVFTPQIAGNITPNTGGPAASGYATPALGQPSMNAGDVNQAYQQAFGRAPDARELASELENANKYGKSGILDQIARRTSNDPGSGDYGVADWSKLGGAPSSSTASTGVPGGPVITLPPSGGNRPQEAPDPTLPLGTLLPPPMAMAGNPAGVAPGPYDQVWWRKYRDQAGAV